MRKYQTNYFNKRKDHWLCSYVMNQFERITFRKYIFELFMLCENPYFHKYCYYCFFSSIFLCFIMTYNLTGTIYIFNELLIFNFEHVFGYTNTYYAHFRLFISVCILSWNEVLICIFPLKMEKWSTLITSVLFGIPAPKQDYNICLSFGLLVDRQVFYFVRCDGLPHFISYLQVQYYHFFKSFFCRYMSLFYRVIPCPSWLEKVK